MRARTITRARPTALAALIAALVAVSGLLALPNQAAAQSGTITTLTVVNQRGVAQAHTEVFSDLSGGPFSKIAETDAYGKTEVRQSAGTTLYFQRGEDDPIAWVMPDPVPSTATVTVPNVPGDLVEPELSIKERWLVGKINELRQSKGLVPVEISVTLSEAADRYASLLWQDKVFISHDYQSTIYTRAVDAGWVIDSPVAENIAAYPTSKEAFQGWIDSPGHYANMTSPGLRTIGIGQVGSVWVTDFTVACAAPTPGFERCAMTGDFGDPTLDTGEVEPPAPNPKPDPNDNGLGKPKITDSPKRRSTDFSPSFAFELKPATGFECKLDRKKWKSCSSPKAYGKVKKKKHVFKVRGLSAGESGPAARFRFRVR